MAMGGQGAKSAKALVRILQPNTDDDGHNGRVVE